MASGPLTRQNIRANGWSHLKSLMKQARPDMTRKERRRMQREVARGIWKRRDVKLIESLKVQP